MYRLDIDLDQLCFAADHHTHTMAFYLDTETGAVVSVRHEDGQLAEAFVLINVDHGALSLDLDAWLDQCGADKQNRNAVRMAVLIERQYGARYLAIPAPERAQCYADMLSFIAQVEDPVLAQWLRDAVQGNGAFGRFRALLCEYDYERGRWFAFRRARVRERMINWLASVGIEPVQCQA